MSKYITFTAVRVLSVNKWKREKVCMKTNDRERLVWKPEKHIRHLVLNARDLPRHLTFDLAFVTGSSVGNATWLALLRHSLAFTSIRRAGQRTSGHVIPRIDKRQGQTREKTLETSVRQWRQQCECQNNATKNRRNTRIDDRESRQDRRQTNRTPAQMIVQWDTKTDNGPVGTPRQMMERTDRTPGQTRDRTERTPGQIKEQLLHHDRQKNNETPRQMIESIEWTPRPMTEQKRHQTDFRGNRGDTRTNDRKMMKAEQEQKMLKWSIITIQGFFTVIFLTKSTIMNIWVASCNFTTEWLQSSSFPMTLWPWLNIKTIQTGIRL